VKVPAELWTREIGPAQQGDRGAWGVDNVVPIDGDQRTLPID